MSNTSIRIDFGNRVFEASGTKEIVDEYLERYSSLLEIFQSVLRSGPASVPIDPSPQNLPAQTSDAIPSEFGEYLHLFGSGISDVDRILVAAHFVQTAGGRGCFTTREANDLLLNQGVKVANASECVRRALNSRRVFSVEKGEYKVSSQGVSHLHELLRKGEE